MRKTKSKMLVAAFLMTQAPTVIAGYYNSSIEGISLDGIYAPKNLNTITKIVCENVDRSKGEYVDMCYKGVLTAKNMAEKYGAGEGTHLGCVDGYQQGIYRGYNQTSNPSIEILRVEQNALKGVELKNAVARGASKASSESRNSTESEIIKRFRDNVRNSSSDQITAPSDDYSNVLKVPRFDGFSDGYAADGKGGSFSNVINAGWVSSSSSIAKRIQARAVARQFGLQSNLSDKCSATPILFNKGLHTVSLWSLFSSYGEYNFKDYGWKSTSRAWNKFASSSDEAAIEYRNIKSVTEKYTYQDGFHKKSVAVEIDELDINGQPTGNKVVKRDANGNIVYKKVDDTSRPIFKTGTRDVPGKSAAELKAKYREAFEESYRNLAKEHFGKAFITAHTVASRMGEDSGKAVGLLVANDIAKQQAYDEVYKVQSATSFARKYENLFKESWFRNFNSFANNPMVELTSFDLSGDGNGIFTRGESVAPILGMRNLGLKSGNVKITLESSSLQSGVANTHVIQAPASLEFSYDGDKSLGSLRDDLRVFDTARLSVSIDGSDMKKVFALRTNADKQIEILDVAPIYDTSARINSTISGDATIYVKVKNPSNTDTSGSVDITAVANDGNTYTASVTSLKAGESKTVPVRITGLDPLFLINSGIRATVSSSVNGRFMNKDNSNTASVNRNVEIANYFNSILTNSTSNYGDDEVKEDRVETLVSMILDRTQRDIESNVDWDDNRDVSSTIIGQLQKKYKSSAAAGKLNDDAKEVYRTLAQELEALYDDVFGYKDYVNQLKVFSGELETRGKKDRKKD